MQSGLDLCRSQKHRVSPMAREGLRHAEKYIGKGHYDRALVDSMTSETDHTVLFSLTYCSFTFRYKKRGINTS